MEPSVLALFWAAVIAVAIVVYVILDGFDLGVGILFGTTRDKALRNEMMNAISPFWDGNETWLVIIGASLFAAFPVVYTVFLPAFYIPVLLLLFGLIFRGVAFEFRYRGSARGLWDGGFFLGSTIAAFVQGAAVGAMVRGIPVVDGQYAGGRFEWLAPLPVFTGIGLVLGYASPAALRTIAMKRLHVNALDRGWNKEDTEARRSGARRAFGPRRCSRGTLTGRAAPSTSLPVTDAGQPLTARSGSCARASRTGPCSCRKDAAPVDCSPDRYQGTCRARRKSW